MATRSARGRRGGTLVMMSILLVGFLGVGAIAADIGRFYSVSTELQTAADAASLAGALALQRNEDASPEADVDTAVMNFVARTNRADGNALAVQASAVQTLYYTPPHLPSRAPLDADLSGRRANAVSVSIAAAPQGFFSQLIGRAANLPLSRTSVAWVSNLPGRCVRPWAFPYRALYAKVSGNAGATDPAPALDVNAFVEFMDRGPADRTFVMLGPDSTSAQLSHGQWTGFNFSGHTFAQGFRECLPPMLDVEANVLGVTLSSQVPDYVVSTSVAIQSGGGGGGPGICVRRPPSDAGCYASVSSVNAGVVINVAWADAPTGSAVRFRHVGEFLLTCYFIDPGETCGGAPGGSATYPGGTIVGTMLGIKSRNILADDVLGNSPSNVQRIILVR